MVSISKEMDSGLNAEKDLSMITIKPEPLSDGRADRIVEWLSEYCNQNNLSIIHDARITMKEEYILAHYGGPNKLAEVGKKVIASIRMSNPEAKEKLESMGFTSMAEGDLGKIIRDKELRDYLGKEFRIMIIAGRDALAKIRSLRGASDPSVSGKGTIRHEFSSGMSIADVLLYDKPLDNVVHVALNIDELRAELGLILNTSPEEALESMVYAKSLIRR
jgi:nucleoside diphosphate kinase